MHWTDSRRGAIGYAIALASHTAWVSNLIGVIFGHIFIERFFFFYFKNKTTNAMYVNTNSIVTTHTHMSEVEVYSVNKLKFWAMDKNVVGKKNVAAGPLVQRAPPEPRPKCDRVDFWRNIRSTPWRIWISATFWRSTNSARDRCMDMWRRHKACFKKKCPMMDL